MVEARGRRFGNERHVTILAAIAAAVGGACATSHFARPLGRGNAVGQASVGGPLVEVSGTPVAAPILTVGGGYGVTERWDVYARGVVT
ncbi:MAG: hypothetical protein JWM82_4098, partial [Myxococcales bacterium]|nr:hypothetical protein [Myxococcales bacterium]